MNKIYILTLIVLLIICGDLNAAEGILNGKVIEYANEKPLAGASIKIEGASIGCMSDKLGNFNLKKLKPGEYTLIVSMIGFETYKTNLIINDKENPILIVKLQEKIFKTAGIVVTANKNIQNVQETPISVSIIDSKSLLDRSINKLEDALRSVPGVEVNKDNISIRGSSGFSFGVGSRALLLLDGFPLLSGDNGDFKGDAIPMKFVDRIEVVKGAGSALYGAGALGGVINVITKEPNDELEIRASSNVGFYTKPRYKQWEFTDNTQFFRSIDIGATQKIGNVGVLLNGSYLKDDGFRAYDDTKRWNLFSKFQYSPNSSLEFKLTTDIASENRLDWIYWNSLDSATKPPSTTRTDNRFVSDKFFTFLEVKSILTDDEFINIKTGYYRTKLENSLSQSDPEYRESIAETYNSELQFNSKLSKKLFLTVGANFLHNEVNAVIYGNHNQNVFSGYAQAEYTILDSLKTTFGGRFDYEKTVGLNRDMEFSPKVAFSYLATDNLNFRLSAGSGFRAPAVAERYAAASFQGFKVLPNTELKSERSISIEAGTTKEFKMFQTPCYIDLAVFQNELYDMIEPAFTGASGTIQFVNTVRARVIGVDFLFRTLLFNSLGFETSLTFMDPKDLNLDKTLKYRSKFLGVTDKIWGEVSKYNILSE